MNTIIIEIFLIFILINEINNLRCGADKIKVNPINLDDPENYEKRRLAGDYSQIKIGVDYTSLSQPSSMSNEEYNMIKNAIEETKDEFKKFLRVQHIDRDLSGQEESIKKSCNLNAIGSGYYNYLKDYDVIIFASFDSSLGSQILSAGRLCLTHGSRPRPTGGVLVINPNYDFSLKNTDLLVKNSLFHEITHILVFDKSLLNDLGMLTTKNSKVYVNSPKVLSKIRRHYNCSSVVGMPFEDQELETSEVGHWEARYMLGDYMISQYYLDMVLSDITIALFEDTKYYEVDYYSGGLFKFGKNKGCNFLNQKCVENEFPSFDEFCANSGQAICSSTRISKGYCIIKDYISNYNITIPNDYRYFKNANHGGFYIADFCPVADISYTDNYFPTNCRVGSSNVSSDYGEIFGNQSFCFVSSLTPSSSSDEVLSRNMCYKVECHKDTLQIVVYVGSTTLICPKDGGIVSGNGFKGYLTCPKYYDICDTESNTPCNDIYNCLTNKVEVDDESFNMNSNTTFDRYIPGLSANNIKLNILTYAILNIIFFLYFI